jgi:hypothetical protein
LYFETATKTGLGDVDVRWTRDLISAKDSKISVVRSGDAIGGLVILVKGSYSYDYWTTVHSTYIRRLRNRKPFVCRTWNNLSRKSPIEVV